MAADPDGPLADVEVTRIVYRSTAGYTPGDPDGSFGVAVSGVVATPTGTPPRGGWPVVAYGHGTTGTNPDCGPSVHPDLLGSAGTIARLARAGYVVAASDYVGLGRRGGDGHGPVTPHPFLDARTEAYSMIDAVRAARAVIPQTGSRWAALGNSQGGQASWASAEYAGTEYGAGLAFVGAAALAPAADVSPIAAGYDARPYRAPTYTAAQLSFIPALVDGLRAVHPDLRVDDYMRGALAAGAPALTDCAGSRLTKYSALTRIQPGDAAISSPGALRTLHAMLARNALPTRRAAGPLFVAYGDADQVIDPDWTAAALRRACGAGDTVATTVEPGAGHTNLASGGSAVAWIGDRFAGRPPPDTC